jgi:hypothetical protein
MQPEDSSLVRRSPFSTYDPLPTLTFLILGPVIGLGLATTASLFHRHSHRSGEILLLAALFFVPTLVFWRWADSEIVWAPSRLKSMVRTADPRWERLGYAMNSMREENFAFAFLPQAVGQQ